MPDSPRGRQPGHPRPHQRCDPHRHRDRQPHPSDRRAADDARQTPPSQPRRTGLDDRGRQPTRTGMSDFDLVAALLVLGHILIALAAAIFVSANRKPSSAIAWVMAVVFIPVIGVLFFLLVGAGRLPKHRREKQRFVSEAIEGRTEGGLDKVSHRDEWPEWLPSVTRLNRNLGALPMIGGNTAELCDGYLDSIRSHGRGHRRRHEVRPRRVLHPRPRRDHRTVLRRPGPGVPARCHGACALRPLCPVRLPEPPEDPRCAPRDGCLLPTHVAAPALPRSLA